MTDGAVRRESCRRVIRIIRVVVIRHVTGRARGGSQVVVVVHVTLRTGHGGMSAGQRKARHGRVIEGSLQPRDGVVALLAGLRESRGHVIRIRGASEILQVA